MRIFHHVMFMGASQGIAELNSLGFDTGEYGVVDVAEDDPRWPAVQALIDQFRGTDLFCWTQFAPQELASAKWLLITSHWHNGYPMPDEDGGYRRATYDLGAFCPECGVGVRQKAPFRIRGEPKWGRRTVMQLNWVFDEVFVAPELWRMCFQPRGVGYWPVLDFKKGHELQTVVQLRVDDLLEDEFDLGDHGFEVCPICRRKKYLPFTRGMFPPMRKPLNEVHAIRVQEWFGSGASARRPILISGEIARQLLEINVRSVDLLPLKEQ